MSRFSGMRFSTLERHHAVTQAFLPLGTIPAVVAVAAPTAAEALPRPDQVRAFLIDGSCGYVLKRGCWHSVDRYPLGESESRIVMLTSRSTQLELQTKAQADWRLTQQVDFTQELGVTFQLVV